MINEEKNNKINNKINPSPKLACIVMPTINEAENLKRLIPQIFDQQEKIHTHQLHVLVVDSCSKDGTIKLMNDFKKQYPRLHMRECPELGLGKAYQEGFKFAQDQFNPEILFQMDGDGQHNPDEIPLFVSLMNHGFDFVIGSRFVYGATIPDFSFYRLIISRIGNAMIRFLGGVGQIHDCTSGYRCIRQTVLKKCQFSFLSISGYAFQSSLLCELLRYQAKVIEIPIVFEKRTAGVSKLRLKDKMEFLINIPKIRFRNSTEWFLFCVVGSLGVVVNLGAYIILSRVFGMSLLMAVCIAIELSILGNFILNDIWTFACKRYQRGVGIRFVLFHLISGLGGAVNVLIFYILLNYIPKWDILAEMIGILGGVLINYNLNAMVTWKGLKKSSKNS